MTGKTDEEHLDFVLCYLLAEGVVPDVIEAMRDLTPNVYTSWIKAGEVAALRAYGEIYETKDMNKVFRADQLDLFRQILVTKRFFTVDSDYNEELVDMADAYLEFVDMNKVPTWPRRIGA